MRYYVITDDGNKFGPADVDTLNQWIQEGRLLPTTLLEEEGSGARIAASAVQGLTFPAPAPGPVTGPATGPVGGPMGAPTGGPSEVRPPQGFGQNPYSQPYQQPYYGGDMGNNDVTVSWVLGVIGLFCCGIILCPIGIVFANRAKEKGHPGAQAPFIFNIVVTVLSVLGVIGSIFWWMSAANMMMRQPGIHA